MIVYCVRYAPYDVGFVVSCVAAADHMWLLISKTAAYVSYSTILKSLMSPEL